MWVGQFNGSLDVLPQRQPLVLKNEADDFSYMHI